MILCLNCERNVSRLELRYFRTWLWYLCLSSLYQWNVDRNHPSYWFIHSSSRIL